MYYAAFFEQRGQHLYEVCPRQPIRMARVSDRPENVTTVGFKATRSIEFVYLAISRSPDKLEGPLVGKFQFIGLVPFDLPLKKGDRVDFPPGSIQVEGGDFPQEWLDRPSGLGDTTPSVVS